MCPASIRIVTNSLIRLTMAVMPGQVLAGKESSSATGAKRSIVEQESAWDPVII